MADSRIENIQSKIGNRKSKIKNQIRIILPIFLFLSISTSFSLGNEVPLTLIYTSNTSGEIESCACPEAGNGGGLSRRSRYIQTVRRDVKNSLILDGGDALVIGHFDSEKEKEKARRRAEIVLNIYEKMEYDALNIGDTDLGLGVEYLKAIQKNLKIPFLSANLKDKKTKKSLFNPYLVKEFTGLKVGIIGLTTSDVPTYIHKEIKGCYIEDPIQVAIDMVKGPMSNCSFIFALAHLNPPEIEDLAKRVPQVSIIIGGNNRSFIFPKQIHRSIWVQTDPYGIHIGRLDLRLTKGSKEFVDVLSRSLIQKNIEEVQKKMGDPQYAKEMKNLKETEEKLLEEKKKLPDAEGKNTYENFLTLLHPGMKSDPEIEKIISSSKEQLERPLP